MMRLGLLILLCCGCGSCASERPAGPDANASVIAIGQPWPEATAAARRAGYELHDAGQLAMAPPAVGFTIDLPGGRGLIVFRDVRADSVAAVQWIENWPGPKAARVYHDVRSFDVPPARGGG